MFAEIFDQWLSAIDVTATNQHTRIATGLSANRIVHRCVDAGSGEKAEHERHILISTRVDGDRKIIVALSAAPLSH